MRKLNVLAVSVMAALMAAPAMADDNGPTVDFHGYMRAGVGHFNHGGANIRWNSEGVGRLGNEDDTYGEIELGSRVFKKGDVEFYVDSMIAVKSEGDNDWESTGKAPTFDSKSSEDADFALRQLNLQIKGLIPGQKDAVIWAGKRYYQRQDVHIWDLYYLDISGSGAGVENLKVGPGNLSLAWTRKEHDGATYEDTGSFDSPTYYYFNDGTTKYVEKVGADMTINYFDARYGVSLWNGGWTELCATVESPNKPKNFVYQHDNGTSTQITANVVFSGAWGWNKTTLQWGNKGWVSGSSWYDNWDDADDAYMIRFINQGEAQFGDSDFHLMHAIRYVYTNMDNDSVDTKKELAVAVRPSYQLTPYTRIMAEVGAFWNKTSYNNGDADSASQGQKYTLAYAIAPSASLFARPELRFYVSWLHSSNGNESISDRMASGNTFTNGVNMGVQAEAWW
ncbi:MAG: carbohydrate porin [Succinivibrio sp.]|nr:carbohydrate porin [Succinivibrio sp.]